MNIGNNPHSMKIALINPEKERNAKEKFNPNPSQ
jgi:hypothetical protein